MKKKYLLSTLVFLVFTGLVFSQDEAPLYLDPNQPIEERVEDLLSRMTLEEKITQVSDDWGIRSIPRLQVPVLYKTEAVHGHSYGTGVTIYPHSIAIASTWNKDLVYKVAKASAVEAKAGNCYQAWSPLLDVAREARWGRVEETYGEDPYLVSQMGLAWITGFQSEGLIATPKHFAGHGQPVGGRDSHDYGFSEREMREVHLVPFRTAFLEAKAKSVMHAYSTWDGEPCGMSKELLQKILREEWEFDGFVVSDCGAIRHLVSKHEITDDNRVAAKLGIEAGVDLNCGNIYGKGDLLDAVKEGMVKEEQIDVSVRRVLRKKFELGLFENPPGPIIYEDVEEWNTPEHREIAYEIAVQSAILLKNENDILPLSTEKYKSIAVIGPNADAAQIGNYSGRPVEGQLISALKGIESFVETKDVQVYHAKGCSHYGMETDGIQEAVEIAKKSDLIVMVMGDEGDVSSGENHDGATLQLLGVQEQLVEAIHKTGKPIVFVLVNGKPFTFGKYESMMDALLVTWYPGQEGGYALADLLFGKRNPSGRLPITFPRHTGQTPMFYNYKTSGRRYDYFDMEPTPKWRFGYGLSYTKFKYSNLQITQNEDDVASMQVAVDVENIGDRKGDEIVQLYVTDLLASVSVPIMQLKRFERISLNPGEKKTVEFNLEPYDLSLLNNILNRVLEPGEFKICVGGSSPTMPTSDEFHKSRVKFFGEEEGVQDIVHVGKEYKADFTFNLSLPEKIKGGENFKLEVSVTNNGNMTDITEIEIYADDKPLATRRFEIIPGQTKNHVFDLTVYKPGSQEVILMAEEQMIIKKVKVSKVPAKLVIENVKSNINKYGQLNINGTVSNIGGEVYESDLVLNINGSPAYNIPVRLNPGEIRELTDVNYTFERSGNYKVSLNGIPLQSVYVSGSISLAGKNPLLNLEFENDNEKAVLNAVDGKKLNVEGGPLFVEGLNGKGLHMEKNNHIIRTGDINLYKRSFTMTASVYIYSFDKKENEICLFGGSAPSGAHQGEKGTRLHLGLRRQRMKQGFYSADAGGDRMMPTNKWITLTYAYNADEKEGTVYLDGEEENQQQQDLYYGPLQAIGSSCCLGHGDFVIDNVSAFASFIGDQAVNLLVKEGYNALKSGEFVSRNKEFKDIPVSVNAVTDIPESSSIKAMVQGYDENNKLVSETEIVLKSGENEYVISGMKECASVGIKILLSTDNLTAIPTLETFIIHGKKDKKAIWSTSGDWLRGVASKSILVE